MVNSISFVIFHQKKIVTNVLFKCSRVRRDWGSDTPPVIEKQQDKNYFNCLCETSLSQNTGPGAPSHALLWWYQTMCWWQQSMLNLVVVLFHRKRSMYLSLLQLYVQIWISYLGHCEHQHIIHKRGANQEAKERKRCYLTFEQRIPPLAQYLPRHGSRHVIDRRHQLWLKAQPCKRGLSIHPAKWFQAQRKIEFSIVKRSPVKILNT